jgi:hypothetical protein
LAIPLGTVTASPLSALPVSRPAHAATARPVHRHLRAPRAAHPPRADVQAATDAHRAAATWHLRRELLSAAASPRAAHRLTLLASVAERTPLRDAQHHRLDAARHGYQTFPGRALAVAVRLHLRLRLRSRLHLHLHLRLRLRLRLRLPPCAGACACDRGACAGAGAATAGRSGNLGSVGAGGGAATGGAGAWRVLQVFPKGHRLPSALQP